jgi:ribosomal protein L28
MKQNNSSTIVVITKSHAKHETQKKCKLNLNATQLKVDSNI